MLKAFTLHLLLSTVFGQASLTAQGGASLSAEGDNTAENEKEEDPTRGGTSERPDELPKKIQSGLSCAQDPYGCASGLCCGEGVLADDVVDGEVQKTASTNMIEICFDESGNKFTNALGQDYYFVCFDQATRAAATALAVVTSVYMTVE